MRKVISMGACKTALLAALLIVPLLVSSARADEAAEAFIRDTASKVADVLKDKSASEDVRREELSKLFSQSVDIKRLAAFSLGNYARSLKSEEWPAYIQLLRDFIVAIYFSRLKPYSDESLQVTGSREKGNKNQEVIVFSKAVFADGRNSVPVDWWLIREDGGFKVFDIRILGVWMAQEQRSTFVSVLRNNGGDIMALMDHLRRQVKAIDGADDADDANDANDG